MTMLAKVIDTKEVAKGTLQFMLKLPEKITFNPGQYLLTSLPTLVYPDPRGNKRFFSIVSVEGTKNVDDISITTRIRDSGFKKTLVEQGKTQGININRIMGDFVLPEDISIPLVFIAGGIGITPFITMIRYVIKHNTTHNITLLYSNRDRESTAFFDELQQISKKHSNIKVIFIMTQDDEWTGEKRRISEELINELIPDFLKKTFMIVGPPAMNDVVEESLQKLSIPQDQIKKENFSGY